MSIKDKLLDELVKKHGWTIAKKLVSHAADSVLTDLEKMAGVTPGGEAPEAEAEKKPPAPDPREIVLEKRKQVADRESRAKEELARLKAERAKKP